MDENGHEINKNEKNARAKRAKLLFRVIFGTFLLPPLSFFERTRRRRRGSVVKALGLQALGLHAF